MSENEIETLKALSAAWDQALVSNYAEAIGRFMTEDWSSSRSAA